jgi:hypothetical protein
VSDVLNRAKAHFRELMAQGLCGPIDVPEWDVKIYYKAVTNFHQEAQIVELTQQNKTVEALVMTLILRALDDQGRPIFNKAEKAEIMRSVDPQIILRIINQMNEITDRDSVEAALGN